MVIKQGKCFLLSPHCKELWEVEHFTPMTAEKKEELFHELAAVNKYPDLTLWYIEANREIRTPETRSFWREENWVIHVLDKYGNLKVHEAKYYPILVKKYSTDPNMIWVSENPKWKSKFWWKTESWIMLKEWNQIIKLNLSKIEVMPWDEKMKCSKLSEEDLNKFYADKMNSYSRFFIEKEDIYKPKFKIKINDDTELYTSSRICTSWYQYVIWYTKINGEWKLRLFYRSHSEWARRACPWEISDWALSKWELIPNFCYETTTKVDYHLCDAFDNRISSIVDGNDLDPILWYSKNLWKEILIDEIKDETHVDRLFSSSEIWNLVIEIAKRNVDKQKNPIRKKRLLNYIEHIRKKYVIDGKWKPMNNCLYAVSHVDFEWFGFVREAEDVINLYSKTVPKGLNIESMKKVNNTWYTYNHEYLWKVICEPCVAKYNWENVIIYFSYAQDNPNLVWIEYFWYMKSNINSFWIRDRQFNAAPLTWKPIEYEGQTPLGCKVKYWKYWDVRFLYQENPIIKQYKKLEGLL